MSRRRRHQPDSLELLLDTMCNTFGGIIMIALLIALVSRDVDADSKNIQSFRKQLEQAQQQTAEAEKLRKRILENADTNVVTAVALLKEREELQERIEADRQQLASNTTLQASISATNDPGELERLLAQKEARQREERAIEEQIQREIQSRQRQLRLPRERVTGKRTFYVIARHGRVYPVYLMRNGERERNQQSIDWGSTVDGDSATPRPGAGIDAPLLARILNDVQAQTYSIHFLVYDDSFPAFLAARKIPLARGYDTGWEFLSQDKPIVFSSRGEAPRAL
jgi:hypothetical protein